MEEPSSLSGSPPLAQAQAQALPLQGSTFDTFVLNVKVLASECE